MTFYSNVKGRKDESHILSQGKGDFLPAMTELKLLPSHITIIEGVQGWSIKSHHGHKTRGKKGSDQAKLVENRGVLGD